MATVNDPIGPQLAKLLMIDEENEAGGSSSTSLLKRKRSGSDIADQDERYATTLGAYTFLSSHVQVPDF